MGGYLALRANFFAVVINNGALSTFLTPLLLRAALRAEDVDWLGKALLATVAAGTGSSAKAIARLILVAFVAAVNDIGHN